MRGALWLRGQVTHRNKSSSSRRRAHTPSSQVTLLGPMPASQARSNKFQGQTSPFLLPRVSEAAIAPPRSEQMADCVEGWRLLSMRPDDRGPLGRTATCSSTATLEPGRRSPLLCHCRRRCCRSTAPRMCRAAAIKPSISLDHLRKKIADPTLVRP